MRAAEMGKTLSALVRDFLTEFGSAETEHERGRRELEDLFEEFKQASVGVKAGARLSRDDLYDRGQAEREAADAARG
ncbi:hypothetical protein [Sphingomonas nostoxanthinifaciens]|uniref:hypothetical protein n=1 Tax=Sphingomonas nostoxanthinifaciens TaxID=2872652 RepID=UPI001CC1D002|nr:hypothetical protein [Sphingomonas nostoxanthinifaciens]UAK24796.1 hypothetical protein K8P63_00800 [Sphingomonas nostoxanthinifaciens]